MVGEKVKIWIWVRDNKIFKALFHRERGILTIYDEDDKRLIRRSGLTMKQAREFEASFLKCCTPYGHKIIYL